VTRDITFLPPPDDAKTRADAETDIRNKLYTWAEGLLEQTGIKQQVTDAQSINDLQHIHLDLKHMDIVFAIRAAMFPVGALWTLYICALSKTALKKRCVTARKNWSAVTPVPLIMRIRSSACRI
jgi:hypothetical protein